MKGIRIENLEVSFGKSKILNNIDFEIRPGKILAFLGPNGAGKSTCMRVLAGLVQPNKGKAYLGEIQLCSFAELRSNCGFLIEKADFYEFFNAYQNLELLASLQKVKISSLDLLEKVGLKEVAYQKVGTFSQGMKQRLGIAQTLIGNPDFLILDEPFNGLDLEIKQGIIQLILELKNQGKGLLISTHLLEEMEALADDFILLSKGKVHLSGNLEEYQTQKQLVTFFFEHDFILEEIDFKVFSREKGKISFWATRDQARQILQLMVASNQIPYRIEWSGVLKEKYLQITS